MVRDAKLSDLDSTSHTHVKMTEASSSADPGSGSAEAVAAAPSVSSAVDTHKLPASQDTCSWYGGKSCSEPRTCHDCLNVAVSGSEVRVPAMLSAVPCWRSPDDFTSVLTVS